MNKRLTKPHEKNERLERPCGLLGVPPDKAIVIITDKTNVKEIVDSIVRPNGIKQFRQ